MVGYLNNPQVFKRTYKPQAQLPAGQAEGQVLGGEPDPVAWREDRRLTAVFLMPTHGPLEMSVRGVPCLLTAPGAWLG